MSKMDGPKFAEKLFTLKGEHNYIDCAYLNPVQEFNQSFSESLLVHYIGIDKDVYLIGDGFKIPVKLGIIQCFIPVMATEITMDVGQITSTLNSSKEIKVTQFNKYTVDFFCKCLTPEIDQAMVSSMEWQDYVELVNFCHYYQCDVILTRLLTIGQSKVNADTIYDAIKLTDDLGFTEWNEEIVNVIASNVSVIKDEQWNELLGKCPMAVGKILTVVFRKSYIDLPKRRFKRGPCKDLFYDQLYAKKLLIHYNGIDEDVHLIVDGFKIRLKLGIIQCFIPVMATEITTNVGKSESIVNSCKEIQVTQFSKNIVEVFLKCLTSEMNQTRISSMIWHEFVELVNFCHYYQCNIMLQLLLAVSESKVNINTIYDAIKLADVFEFTEWNQKILDVINANDIVIGSEKWDEILVKCPIQAAKIITKVLCKKHEEVDSE